MLEINIIFAFSFVLLGWVVSIVVFCIAPFIDCDIAYKLIDASSALLRLGIIYIAVVAIVALAGAIL